MLIADALSALIGTFEHALGAFKGDSCKDDTEINRFPFKTLLGSCFAQPGARVDVWR